MAKKVYKHNLLSLNQELGRRNLSLFLTAVSINEKQYSVTIKDSTYGNYIVDLKSFSSKSQFPKHKRRRHVDKMMDFFSKYVGQTINGLKVVDAFYGPDRGYKNRSFYLECIGECGHASINSYALLTKHRKQFVCRSCSKTEHGERGKIEGALKKRTPSYLYWSRHKNKFPISYQKFIDFKNAVGDRPSPKSIIVVQDDKIYWKDLQVAEDKDIQLMASALRSAFKYSSIYKKALEDAKVETETGTKYRCAACGELWTRNKVQVDHIEPIAELSGESLRKEELIDKIWNNNIQVLDNKCHTQKSTKENAIRRQNKKLKRILK